MSSLSAASINWKRAREDAGLEQAEAALTLGIHRVTLGRYENGHAQPPAELIERMRALYGLHATTPAADAGSIEATIRDGQREAMYWVKAFAERVLEAQLHYVRTMPVDAGLPVLAPPVTTHIDDEGETGRGRRGA
jgi:transcriptional regulator with XRE-family HTH domain